MRQEISNLKIRLGQQAAKRGTDCEQLSSNARRIFEKMKEHYPPNPWGESCWKEDGLVQDYSNTIWYDLRKSRDRQTLIDKYISDIGRRIVLTARSFRKEKKKLRACDINLKACERWIDLVMLLGDLDFQIETMDLVES